MRAWKQTLAKLGMERLLYIYKVHVTKTHLYYVITYLQLPNHKPVQQ